MAECSKIAWSEGKTPGGSEPVRHVPKRIKRRPPRGEKTSTKPSPVPEVTKGFCLILFGISNVEIASDVLDIKRSKPRRKMIVIESVFNRPQPVGSYCHKP